MEPTPKPFNHGTRVIPLKYPFMERGDHPIATTVSHFESVKNRRKQKTWVPSASLHLTASKNALLFLPFLSRRPSRGRRSLRGALHNSLSYLWVIFAFCSFSSWRVSVSLRLLLDLYCHSPFSSKFPMPLSFVILVKRSIILFLSLLVVIFGT